MTVPSVAGPKPKVLIVSDDPMGGHRAAARAVNEALKDITTVDAKSFEFHDMCAKTRRYLREEQIILRKKTPALTRWGFRRAMNPGPLLRTLWRAMSWVNHMSMWTAQRMVRDEDPDILLSVHMGTNALSRIWEKHHVLKAPAHSVVTDYVAHGVWPSSNIQRYYVATDDVKQDLERYGVAPEKIMVTGIPVSQKTIAPDSRPQADIKQAIGLDPKLPMILICGGSQGDQKYMEILEALEKQGNKAQVVALCGRSAERREAVETFGKGLSFPVIARPFVDMRDYYKAADVIVTKPGGLTTTEVMAQRKALILVSPYPGMEEVNVQRLTKAGVAAYGDTPENAAAAAQQLLTDSGARDKMIAAQQVLVPTNAASRIAADLVASMRPFPQAAVTV